MIATQPAASLLFGPADAAPMSIDESTVKPWQLAEVALASAGKMWLSTVRPDGRPHTMPVLVVLVDGRPCFTSRPGSHKAKNLANNPQCTVALSDESVDLIVEGVAQRAQDEMVHRIAAAFTEKYGWHLALRDGRAYEDNLPGSPEYAFYTVTPSRAYGYGPDGLTATRWTFGER